MQFRHVNCCRSSYLRAAAKLDPPPPPPTTEFKGKAGAVTVATAARPVAAVEEVEEDEEDGCTVAVERILVEEAEDVGVVAEVIDGGGA